MNIPHVIFSYNQEKDIKNIQIGFDTVRRGRRPDRELTQIIQQYGNAPSEEDIKAYLISRWKNKEALPDLIVKQLQEYWDTIEEKYFNHLADRMQLTSFHEIKQLGGFLSVRYGSGYNAEQQWFAVSVYNGTMRNTLTAMHEIMHIFFHKQWWSFCKNQGLPDNNIWDVKESMTVLLNLWFKNQIIDTDWGYDEHTELRRFIIDWFLEARDFQKTLEKACAYMKKHPEKSPDWLSNQG
ncbi:MAG: hypothetical protein NUV61_02390 [Candidatus Azambacteria bacterium]|nr:hypothetical protein [Candidatus Azambacteria bacterium]